MSNNSYKLEKSESIKNIEDTNGILKKIKYNSKFKKIVTSVGVIIIVATMILMIPFSKASKKDKGTNQPEPYKFSINYVVEYGDTLGSISRETGVYVYDIKQANKIEKTNYITTGQILEIPMTLDVIDYTIKEGDTLLTIAEQNNTTIDILIAINKISDPDLIIEGRKIKIPVNQEEKIKKYN